MCFNVSSGTDGDCLKEWECWEKVLLDELLSVSNIVLHTELLVSLSINYLWYSVGCEFTLGRIVQGVKITP